MTPEFGEVSATKVIEAVSAAMPADVRPNIIVVGSLAAAYQLFRDDGTIGVRTKDVDCVLSPALSAVDKGRDMARALTKAGWKQRADGRFGQPGSHATPSADLPAIRLHPPGDETWFVELLTEPVSEDQDERLWTRVEVEPGCFYGLPSFAFTGISTFEA